MPKQSADVALDQGKEHEQTRNKQQTWREVPPTRSETPDSPHHTRHDDVPRQGIWHGSEVHQSLSPPGERCKERVCKADWKVLHGCRNDSGIRIFSWARYDWNRYR